MCSAHSVRMLKESQTVILHSVRFQYLAVIIGVFSVFYLIFVKFAFVFVHFRYVKFNVKSLEYFKCNSIESIRNKPESTAFEFILSVIPFILTCFSFSAFWK